MELPLRVALVALGFPLLCVGCGWCLLAPVTDLDREERFAASGGVGAAFLAATAFVTFLTGLLPLFIDGLALLVFLAVVILARFRPPRSAPVSAAPLWPLIALSALGYLHLLGIQTLLPQYVGGMWLGDWQHHYLGARVFAGLEPVDTQWGGDDTYTVASRTPLFNLAAASVLEVAGPDFCVFQAASTFLNACFLPVVYLLLRDLFGRGSARLGLLLAPLNLWMLHLAWFTWPKMLAASFLLLGLHFYLRSLRHRTADPRRGRRCFYYCWVSCLLAYMTHQVAVVYLMVLAGHATVLALRERRFGWEWGRAAFLALSAVLALGPWYGWLLYHFGAGATVNSTPTAQMDPVFGQTHGLAKVVYVLLSVGHNLAGSVIPFAFVRSCCLGPWTFDEFYARATDFYFNLLTAALTVSLSLYLLARGVRSLGRGAGGALAAARASPEWSAVWAVAVLGAVGAAALHPMRSFHGVAHSAIFPTAVLLVVLAWGVLSRASRAVRALVGAGMVAEFLVMFWSHLRLLDPLLFDPPFNTDLKSDNHLVFLNDCLGSTGYLAVLAVVAVQVVLVTLLAVALVSSAEADSP